MRERISSLTVVLVLFWTATLTAQTADQAVKFRLAQTYEQAGDFEKAARVYEELLAREPSNFVYFDGLQRMYMQLKRYDKAIILLKDRLSMNPGDVNLLGILGSVYYKAGNEKEAEAFWEKAIAVDPTNQNVYRIIASIELENRLLDKAADVYRRARVACNDPSLFTTDLAQLLAVSMDYAGSTREFVRWLRQNPNQLSYVQGRMASFTGKEEARKVAMEVVRDEIRRSEETRLYELLGWLALEGKSFSDALEIYKKIDQLSNAQGGALYAFAERVYKEKAFEVAAKAYLELINMPVAGARLPSAQYGYASSLMQLSLLADTLAWIVSQQEIPETESQPHYAGALAYFRKIIAEYPRTEFSARSYYQIGTLQFERYFDLDGALNSFGQVERELPGNPMLHYAVGLKIGEILIARGDTARAAARFLQTVDAPDATPDQQDEAGYRLAELAYFGGDFDSAIDRLSEISFDTKADYANDALQLLSFLQENTLTAKAALTLFARADFLGRQRKLSEAIPIFQQLIQDYPQALLVDDALMKVASLQAKSGRYQDALESYQRLLNSFAETSIALDRAQFNMADIYHHGLKDIPKALAAYEKLLADYPQSVLCTHARKLIRELRGDTL